MSGDDEAAPQHVRGFGAEDDFLIEAQQWSQWPNQYDIQIDVEPSVLLKQTQSGDVRLVLGHRHGLPEYVAGPSVGDQEQVGNRLPDENPPGPRRDGVVPEVDLFRVEETLRREEADGLVEAEGCFVRVEPRDVENFRHAYRPTRWHSNGCCCCRHGLRDSVRDAIHGRRPTRGRPSWKRGRK